MENTNTRGVMPSHAGKPGVWGEGEGQVKSEGVTQINSRKGADSQVNSLPGTHTLGPGSHTHSHTPGKHPNLPMQRPKSMAQTQEVKHFIPRH